MGAKARAATDSPAIRRPFTRAAFTALGWEAGLEPDQHWLALQRPRPLGGKANHQSVAILLDNTHGLDTVRP